MACKFSVLSIAFLMLAHLGVADEDATCNLAHATCNGGGHVLLQKAFRSEGKTRDLPNPDPFASQPGDAAATTPCTCVVSDPSWTPSVRSVPRCVFIDLGAADGNSFQTFLSNGFGDLAECPGGQWSAVLVEANPLFNTKLAAVAAQHPGQINVMSSTAAYMCEATTSFFLDTKNTDKNFWGSSMSNSHPDVQGGKEKVTVPTMNLNKILHEETIPGDWVTVKMDIEGSEYDVLPCTAQAPAASLIDRLYMEQHTWLTLTGLAGTTAAQMDVAKNTLRSRGVDIPDYHTIGVTALFPNFVNFDNMPTVTTTVTSACASGVVTTQTTTQATPEPATAKQTLADAIKGKTFHSGRLAQIAKCTATTQKGFDAIVGAFQACSGIAQVTDSYFNVVKTGPLSMTNIYVFGSEDAFLKAEAVFGTIEETKIAIAEGVQLDCHMMGNITATIRAKLAVWDAVPGFSVNCDTPSSGCLGSSGGRDGSGDVYGYTGEFTFATEEDLLATANSGWLGGLWGLAYANFSQHMYCFYPGGNKMMFAATFQKADYIEFLKAVESDAEAGTTLVETYGKGSGTFLTFGACDEIKAALEKWNTLLPTMGLQMDCSIGGVDHDGICGCTIDSFYGSTADRNAAQQQFGKLVAVCKQNNVMTFCTIDRGDCGLRMIFVAPSCAVWKAVNDYAAADPDFGEIAVGKAMTAKATAFGSITTDYYKELFGWSQTTPQFQWSGPRAAQAANFSSQPYAASDQSLAGQQTFTFKTEAACEASFTRAIPFGNIWTECGACVFDFQTSSQTSMRVFIFPTPASLAKANEMFGARAEETALLLADSVVDTIMFGAETAETKSLLDVWRASPTFDITSMPLKSGYV